MSLANCYTLLCFLYFTMVTRQLQAERRTGSVHRPKTGVLPTVLRNQLKCFAVTLRYIASTCWWHVACRGRWPHRAPPGHAPAAEKPPPRRRSPPLTATPRPSRALSSRSCCRPGDDGCCSGPTDGGRAAAKTWRHMVSGSCQLSRSLNDD